MLLINLYETIIQKVMFSVATHFSVVEKFMFEKIWAVEINEYDAGIFVAMP